MEFGSNFWFLSELALAEVREPSVYVHLVCSSVGVVKTGLCATVGEGRAGGREYMALLLFVAVFQFSLLWVV